MVRFLLVAVAVAAVGCDERSTNAPPIGPSMSLNESTNDRGKCPEIDPDELGVTCDAYELCTRRCSEIDFGEDARWECVEGCDPPTGVSEDFALDWGWECAGIGHRYSDLDLDQNPDGYAGPSYLCVEGHRTCKVLAEGK